MKLIKVYVEDDLYARIAKSAGDVSLSKWMGRLAYRETRSLEESVHDMLTMPSDPQPKVKRPVMTCATRSIPRYRTGKPASAVAAPRNERHKHEDDRSRQAARTKV